MNRLHLNYATMGQIRVINPRQLHFVDKACEWSYANIIVP